jgi:anti-sigma regulatory factor (Ser/Thr protein kinase)
MDDSTIRPVSVAELSVASDARSPGTARRFLAATLGEWGCPEYGDDAALLLTELVTNAALHAKTDIVIRVELGNDHLRVAVTDSSPRQPVVRHYSEQSTTGRGLALVSAVARRWGIEPNPDGTKTVWAEVGSGSAQRQPLTPHFELHVVSALEEPGPSAGGLEGPTSLRRVA